MAHAQYRGFNLKTAQGNSELWQVKIKNHLLEGSFASVKKSIDWWCDTASIIAPKEFASLEQRTQEQNQVEDFHGFTLKNDTGEANAWYCMFNGKLIKGSKLAIQKHIEAYFISRKKQAQQKK